MRGRAAARLFCSTLFCVAAYTVASVHYATVEYCGRNHLLSCLAIKPNDTQENFEEDPYKTSRKLEGFIKNCLRSTTLLRVEIKEFKQLYNLQHSF